uniref:Major Facilitator Superfamily (MFS) putative n=1 Tax=Albugo laibachii Nc14 TaxID=890382 RepID=F0W975_9STRA|nr:Major Facilitator Superfamily (MFS) putative [Albugo laibachii Nc14]|eukprot:CCA17688.1 Major Facilitator Superfamily (MFS) putative [Albugo laibachii Nc14]
MLDYVQRTEPNVRLVLAFTMMYWFSESILMHQVLSGYMYILTGSIKAVGILRGIQGLAQVILALPAGYAADRYRRDRMLKVAAGIGVLSGVMTAVAAGNSSLRLMYVTFAMWGAFSSFHSPAVEAIFADSVPCGRRSFPFTVKFVIMNSARMLGPLIAIVFFTKYEDDWALFQLRAVILIGAIMITLSMLPLLYFDDDVAYEVRMKDLVVEQELRSIGRHFDIELSDSIQSVEVHPTGNLYNMKRENGLYSEGSERSRLLFSPYGSIASPEYVPPQGGKSPGSRKRFLGHLSDSHVPYLLVVSGFIINNAAGITASFLPLFLVKDYDPSFVQMQSLFVVQPVCVALFSLVLQWQSKRWGRMPVIVVSRFLGSLCMYQMATAQAFRTQVALYLINVVLIRSTEPLQRSLLMDFLPRQQRAKWSSLEDLSALVCTGSALIGVYLMETQGFHYCVWITLPIYVVGVLLETLLIPLTRHARESVEDF